MMTDRNKLKPRRSYTANSVPVAGTGDTQLDVNEIAINYADKILYVNQAGTIVSVPLGGSGGGGGGSLSGSVTIPASGDPYWSDTVLLLKGDGNLADSSSYARSVTAYGNAAATGEAKFGVASFSFDGNGDYLRIPASNEFNINGDYVIEFWLKPASVSGVQRLVANRDRDAGLGFDVYLDNAAMVVQVGNASGTPYIETGSSAITVNTWHHVVIVVSGSNSRLYINGSTAASGTLPTSMSTTVDVTVGCALKSGSPTTFFSGLIDDIRLTRSTRGYTGSTIAVPTATYVTGPYTASQTLPGTITGSGGGGSGEDTALRAFFVPPAPTSVTATANNAQATVSWTAPTVLSVTPITDYVVQYSSNSGSSWTTFSDGTSTATTATVTGLTNGTAYQFRVAAVNGVGAGAYSAASSAVTPGVIFIEIPTMTGDTSPSGTASASPLMFGTAAYAAFDGNFSSHIVIGQGVEPWYLQYDFGPGLLSLVSGYSVGYNSGQASDRWLQGWVFEGSNDGVNYVALDTQTGRGFIQTNQVFSLPSAVSYRMYRIRVTAVGYNSSYTYISNFQLLP